MKIYLYIFLNYLKTFENNQASFPLQTRIDFENISRNLESSIFSFRINNYFKQMLIDVLDPLDIKLEIHTINPTNKLNEKLKK
jgi:hypothetical protein